MKPDSWWRLAVGMLAFAWAANPQAPVEGCGFDEIPVFSRETTPDARAFVEGKLGVLHAEYKSEYLVVAYRHLSGLGLSKVAGDSFVAAQQTPLDTGARAWLDERGEAGFAAKQVWVETSLDVTYFINCLPNAFETATVALKARIVLWGSPSPELTAWVNSQDKVFEACSGQPSVLPPPSAVPDPTLQRDYAYQRASHAFYLGDFAAARKGFEAIARDPRSEWRHVARYLVARTFVREALLAKETNPDLLRQAQRHTESMLSDPRERQWHAAARDYLRFIRVRTEPELLYRELSQALSTSDLGTDFGQNAVDFGWLDRQRATTVATNELEQWLLTLRHPTAERHLQARKRYATSRSPAWLIATLMTAEPNDAPALTSVLQDALSLTQDHPGYLTARAERARLLLRRVPNALLYPELVEALSATPEELRSSKNELTLLALNAAPDLKTTGTQLTVVAAGYNRGSFELAEPEVHAEATFYPESAQLINSGLTVAQLLQLAEQAPLPAEPREQLLSAVWLRAQLLDKQELAQSARRALWASGSLVGLLNSSAAPDTSLAAAMSRVDEAPNKRRRNLELALLLARRPWLSISVKPWGPVLQSPEINTAYADYLWKGVSQPTFPNWQSQHQRSSLSAELTQLARLGPGVTALAERLLAAQRDFPNDSRIPEALHRFVRLTRYATHDARKTHWSRTAFRVLHEHYPNDPWAKKTKYYY